MLPSSQYNDERYCHSITSFFYSFEKNPLCLSEYYEYYPFEHVKHMKNHWVIWGIQNVSVIHSLLSMPEFSRVVPSPHSLKKIYVNISQLVDSCRYRDYDFMNQGV